jgi:transposase InsO family protein
MDESVHGSKYILSTTDEFTRYVWLYAMENKDAVSVADRLIKTACNFGFPAAIKSDKGTEFENQIMENLSKAAGFAHHKVVPYNHHANGLIERQNRTIKDTVLKLCRAATKANDRWDEFVHLAQLHINMKMHSVNKSSPFGLMFGRGAFSAWPEGTDEVKKSDTDKWKDYWHTYCKALVPQIHTIQKMQFDRRSANYGKHTSVFKPGDIVMHRLEAQGTKKYPKAVGPFKIKEQSSSGDYILEAKNSTFKAPANFLHKAQLRDGEELAA